MWSWEWLGGGWLLGGMLHLGRLGLLELTRLTTAMERGGTWTLAMTVECHPGRDL